MGIVPTQSGDARKLHRARFAQQFMALLWGLLLGVAWQARAKALDLTEMPLEHLLRLEVAAGSRLSHRPAEAPFVATVLTAQDIRDFGHRSLADVLRTIPGLHLTYDRNYTYLGVRGFACSGDYNSRVLLLIDGRRVPPGLAGTLL